jgi:cytochrome c biogenesis protein CcmG/thiol:disulfide interchange protein DsbE
VDESIEPAGRHPSGLEPPSRGRRRRGRWVVFAAVLAAVTLAASLFALGLSRDPTVVRSALIGRAAPAFDLPLLSGPGTVRLSDLRGKVVVLNFWASWCADCRIEHSALAAAWDRYRDQGVVLVGVAFEDTVSSSRAFAQSLGMDWPIVSDAASRTALAYGVYGVPETFFIGPDGVVASRWVGPVPYAHLTDEITLLQVRPGA